MCELLGMSANVPTDICFSFTGLMQRGGKTGPHRDGWGIAFYEGPAARTFHEPASSADSKLAAYIHSAPIKSCLVVAHIRKATHGRVCLANTHPFVRELWGRAFAFAHNGKLPRVKRRRLGFYEPVGETDSEHAFCWMLDRLRRSFPRAPKESRALGRFVRGLAEELSHDGTFNMLLGDGDSLYAFCGTKLAFLTRKAPFGRARLADAEVTVDFAQETTPKDVVTVVATQPLTQDETWTAMSPGELRVFRKGRALVLPERRGRRRAC